MTTSHKEQTFMNASTPRADRTAHHRRIAPWLGVIPIALSGSARADPTSVRGSFSDITDILQVFTTFMTGPFGKAVVVISIIAAFCTWVFAPKDGIFGPILRVVVAGITIMNAATWVANLGEGKPVRLGMAVVDASTRVLL
jgi:type IV secretory pathway VirB2 component (pilin)